MISKDRYRAIGAFFLLLMTIHPRILYTFPIASLFAYFAVFWNKYPLIFFLCSSDQYPGHHSTQYSTLSRQSFSLGVFCGTEVFTALTNLPTMPIIFHITKISWNITQLRAVLSCKKMPHLPNPQIQFTTLRQKRTPSTEPCNVTCHMLQITQEGLCNKNLYK